MLELKRDIYEKLIEWKKEDTGKVLELNGARQVGKTFILDKFARENYKKYFYINMVETSGKEFLECYHVATKWKPGEKRIEKPLHKTFSLFDESFVDDKDTIVVIDEIQESAEVYSMIRQFAREFSCHFVVTGSYLGKTLSKEYFLPAGDIDTLVLDTLSYEEFLGTVGMRVVYDHLDLYGQGKLEEYEELKKWYDIYIQIGGYPAVVKCYLETKDMEKCKEELVNIIHIFVSESERYFNDVLEMNLFEQLFPSIAQSMIKESKGSSDLVSELSKVIFKEESDRVTKKSVHQAIAWLYRSHIIGYCDKVNECNIIEVSYRSRFYFCDIGVARYFLRMAGADRATIEGIINENFVYFYLERLVREQKLAGISPAFGVYKGGEIDFFMRSLKNYKDCAIEVKPGKNIGKTANMILKDGKADYLYLLKGDTHGGIVDKKKYTVPIYLTGKIAFDR
ncbi:ATP-binding protein [Faecalimonas sp.]